MSKHVIVFADQFSSYEFITRQRCSKQALELICVYALTRPSEIPLSVRLIEDVARQITDVNKSYTLLWQILEWWECCSYPDSRDQRGSIGAGAGYMELEVDQESEAQKHLPVTTAVNANGTLIDTQTKTQGLILV